MTWIIPYEQEKFRHSRARLVDRLFGLEYTEFENNQIQSFNEAKRSLVVDITGFVSWINNKQFLLLPTRTTPNPYIICQIPDDLHLPADNQYVTIKGNMIFEIESRTTGFAHKILQVEDIQPAKTDFGLVKPDISKKEFEQYLFDGWINIDPITQNFIAQSLVSSPTTAVRVGGLTTSLFNPPRQQRIVNLLHSDIRRLVAPELYDKKSGVFEVRELGTKHTLPPFDWSSKVTELETPSQTIVPLLDRVPHGNQEYSISLLARASTPESFESRGLVKSDYPIVLEEHVERRRNPYYTSSEITKYLIATHMNSPELPYSVYQKSINFASNELQKLSQTKAYMVKMTGKNRFLDLSVNGKPLSILNLAISRERSSINKTVDFSEITKTTKDYVDNLAHISDVWYDQGVGKMNALTSFSYDEQKIWAFLDNNGHHTVNELSEKTGIDYDLCLRIISSLSLKGAVWVDLNQKYHPVPLL